MPGAAAALPALLVCLKIAMLQPELWSALRALLLYLNLARFQPELPKSVEVAKLKLELRECTLRTTLVPRSCEFLAGAAGVRFAY